MFRDLVAYLRENKKLWLLPIIVVILVAVALAVLIKAISVSPFVYTLF